MSIKHCFFCICWFLSACTDITPYQKEILTFRKEKNFHFKNLPDSPIPDSLKAFFQGLNYFPIDEKWKIPAKFISEIHSTNLELAGYVEFEYQTRKYQLTVFWEDTFLKNELFLPFKDKTNNKTTYGGGRYLNIPYKTNQKEVILDFNYAYNPYCAYNPLYVCQKPPKENELDFEVLAGEKSY